MNTKTVTTRSKSTPKSAASKSPLAASVREFQDCINPEARLELLKQLTASIKKHGQRMPIVMRGRQILDGNLRWNACQALGLKPKTVDVSSMGTAINDEDLWLVLNEARRHLSLNERGILAALSSAGSSRGVNQHSKIEGKTKKESSTIYSVSTDTIEKIESLLPMRGMRERLLKGESPTALLRDAKTVEQAKRVGVIKQENGSATIAFDHLIAKGVKLGMVYADPPWDYGRGDSKICGEADPRRHYPTMTLEDIKGMPVGKIAAKDSLCWLWVPNCLLDKGVEVLKAWGFNYVTSMVWEKTAAPPSKGAILPFHETLLVGKRGEGLKHVGKPARSAHKAANTGRIHSRKPAWFAEEIERLYPKAGKIELFCREPRKGWIAWGNEAKGAGRVKTAAKKPTRTR